MTLDQDRWSFTNKRLQGFNRQHEDSQFIVRTILEADHLDSFETQTFGRYPGQGAIKTKRRGDGFLLEEFDILGLKVVTYGYVLLDPVHASTPQSPTHESTNSL